MGIRKITMRNVTCFSVMRKGGENTKRKILMLFGVILAFLMVGMAFADVVWYDVFDDNQLGRMWTVLGHGYTTVLEQNQQIEAYIYAPWPGENWMSAGLQLVNTNWIPFTAWTYVKIEVPHYWGTSEPSTPQQVDLVLTNSIYNPMSAHRRYTLLWKHGANLDDTWIPGFVEVIEQIGTGSSTLYSEPYFDCYDFEGGWTPPRYTGYWCKIAFMMVRVDANTVDFWVAHMEKVGHDCFGEWTGIWEWQYLCEDSSYSLGTNYPDYIFEVYGNIYHWSTHADFDNFYVTQG